MVRAEVTHPWNYSRGFNRVIDFCVWGLEVDGLHVHPFSSHPEGNGILRAAGLNAEDWQSWLVRVADMQYHQMQALQLQARGIHNSSLGELFTFIPHAYYPPAAWTGDIAVRNKLDELWEQYKPIMQKRREWERGLSRQWSQAKGDGTTKRLWDDLQAYSTQLETLLIYFVRYPREVDYLVPPVSVIMTVVNGQLDGENFRTRVLRAAAELATSGHGTSNV